MCFVRSCCRTCQSTSSRWRRGVGIPVAPDMGFHRFHRRLRQILKVRNEHIFTQTGITNKLTFLKRKKKQTPNLWISGKGQDVSE